jgi:hypothetical protein
MPLVSPITGADEAPTSNIYVAAESSIGVIGSASNAFADNSIDITGLKMSQSLNEINIAKADNKVSDHSIDIGVSEVFESDGSIDIVKGEGFLILADVLQTEFVEA